jgi:N-acetylneuraminic acid mutarotase
MDEIIKEFEQQLAAAAKTAVERAKKETNRLLRHVEEERRKALAEVRQKSQELAEEIHAMQELQDVQNSQVTLDVGGHLFKTSISTLRKTPGSMLDAMFSGRYQVNSEDDGSVFIDRDGSRFTYLLDYFRDGSLPDNASVSLLRQLKREFAFYAVEVYQQQEVAFVVGGIDENDKCLTSTHMFNPLDKTWSPVASMKKCRDSFGMAVVSGEIYVSGGLSKDYDCISSMERYNPTTNVWSEAASMPTDRCCHGAAVIDGRLYIVGGWTVVNTVVTVSQDIMSFDPFDEKWCTDLAPMPARRAGFGMCVIGKDIFVLGGYDDISELQAMDSVFRYNTISNQWFCVQNMPEPRHEFGVCVFSGMIYIAGGENTATETLRTACVYDPATDEWSPVADMLHGRHCFGLFVLNDQLFAAGGSCSDIDITTMDKYDCVTNRWSTSSNMVYSRREAKSCTMVLDINMFDILIDKRTKLV